MSALKSICIYCGSNDQAPDHYKKTAYDLGVWLADNHIKLIYGGGRCGLMGQVAEGALGSGGQVSGVMPQDLVDREVAHKGLSELLITRTLQERQTEMARLADGFIVLPGGYGTLAEFFEALTWKQLGYHQKPIFVLNEQGFWANMLTQFERCAYDHFLYERSKPLYHVSQSLTELLDQLQSM